MQTRQSERRRTQHVYESYNSEERDNDEDTACYHDAQSRLRPSRQQLLNGPRPTLTSPRSCGRRPVRGAAVDKAPKDVQLEPDESR
uniref:Uncharacterized protein n=1 Tax=Macrostomum lignano TaxID=282301 RepID=A0A1I8H1U1_9PLAT